ncbi:FERM, ARHGEF and pleckstrin domain-containing protein 1 isoform X1 [Triplophysa dalaica]|uniref:FERM, ARHGEF and pleckstrin domain-containing protein 1 isoform X1 n=1 Tax=Triplophysa dalaica TaxID=1582913 RepID=UPI0024DF9DD2|nr:FERM, ARHGEF and pleckstrin domain-containing protein 1 isoform X1 [Triplophysa dalaica]
MVEQAQTSSAGQRLGAPETLGISTLEPGHKPAAIPPGRPVSVRVLLLDDSEVTFDISHRCSGRVLFEMVCSHLNLIEGDYFCLEFQNHHRRTVWLDLLKPIRKQITRPKHTVLRFVVKYFPPDHSLILEELTRYLFALQVRQDLTGGRLTCSDSSAALLVSHIIQSEIGDFEETQCRQHLLNTNYISDQMALMDKIMEFHRKHVGQTPAVSDKNLLEAACRLEMYGMRLQPAKDRDGTRLSLAAAHNGVLVFQGHTKINSFSWSNIRKLSFKRRRFLIKPRADQSQNVSAETLEFLMSSRDCCKMFWKICVEYHAFFRLYEEPRPKPKPVLFSRGSSFRFSGRTQKQVIDHVKENEFRKLPFERKHSRVRYNVSTSPLLATLPNQARKQCREGSFLVSSEDSAVLLPCGNSSPSTRLNGCGEPTFHVQEDSRRQAIEQAGLASLAAKGSSSSIPYIDCSDAEFSEHEVRGRLSRSQSRTRDSVSDRGTGFAVPRSHQKDRYLGNFRQRESPPLSPVSPAHSYPSPSSPIQSAGYFESPLSGGGTQVRGPLHSTLLDELAARSPIKHYTGTRSLTSSPAPSSFHRTGSLSHAQYNGYGGRHLNSKAGLREDRGGLFGSGSPLMNQVTRALVTLVNGHAEDCRAVTPSPLISPLLNDTADKHIHEDDDNRRKMCPADEAYFITKELLNTERTHLKDLELITVWFQAVLDKEECVHDSLKKLLSSTYEPLHKHHTRFLRELHETIALWEAGSHEDVQCVGDLLLKLMLDLKSLTAELQMTSECVCALEKACAACHRLERVCREFELQKVCYVPLNVFLLRPGHRLLHYTQILNRLLKHYPETHTHHTRCTAALAEVCELEAELHSSLLDIENHQKLLELQKDVTGVQNVSGRQLIRQGCLSKLSGKGLQQRMFFLFNDVLLYSTRGITSTNQFSVHKQLPLRGMTIRESEDEWGVPHSFTLMVQQQSLVVAACSESEMEKWMEDLKMAVDLAEESDGLTSDLLMSNKHIKSSGVSEVESEDDVGESQSSLVRHGNSSANTLHRGNTIVHVCWHRNTSVSMLDFSIALQNQLSGNLLRKFKNSNGWQKLWVVFTNFTLFFYKTHEDEYPLASLPLLGYSVTKAGESENIHKDHVFKLHFKSHVYFFRTESEYFFQRWMTVIRSATVSASRTRYLNRTEPD